MLDVAEVFCMILKNIWLAHWGKLPRNRFSLKMEQFYFMGEKPNLFTLLWGERKCNAHLQCNTIKAYVYMPIYKYTAIYIWLEITWNKIKLDVLWVYCICSSTLFWVLIRSLSADNPSLKLSKHPVQFWFFLTILISKESRKMCFTGAPKPSWSGCAQHSETQLFMCFMDWIS